MFCVTLDAHSVLQVAICCVHQVDFVLVSTVFVSISQHVGDPLGGEAMARLKSGKPRGIFEGVDALLSTAIIAMH
jgi:hypothetical protein